MARIGGPLYDPTSVNAGVGGGVHTFHRYKGAGGVSLHPLQRNGQVSAASHSMGNVAQAAHGPNGLGDPTYGAAVFDMRTPPTVPIGGSSRDARFMV